GNPAYGGDWILEMGNVDLTARYFAAGKLDYFKGVLGSTAGSLNSNGNGTGSLIQDFGSSGSAAPFYAALESNGDIVVAGSAEIDGIWNAVLARYSSNGVLDAGFGTNGVVYTDFCLLGLGNLSDAHVNAMTLDASGDIVIVGKVVDSYNSSHQDFLVAKYDPTGNLNGNFTATYFSIGHDSVANAVAVDSSNNIVVAGYTYYSGRNVVVVARYTQASVPVLDTGFGTSGHAYLGIGDGPSQANAVAIDTNGNIVVGGFVYNAGYNQFLLARFTNSGLLDSSTNDPTTPFGASQSGYVFTTSSQSMTISAIAIQTDGKIVAGGNIYNGSTYEVAVVRYLADGSGWDTSFNASGANPGMVEIGNISYNSYLEALTIDGSGNIVTAGNGGSTGNYITLARITPSGALDSSFGMGAGTTYTQFGAYPAASQEANSVAIQTDGKIIAAGYVDDLANSQYGLGMVRFNSIGTFTTVSSSTSPPSTTQSAPSAPPSLPSTPTPPVTPPVTPPTTPPTTPPVTPTNTNTVAPPINNASNNPAPSFTSPTPTSATAASGPTSPFAATGLADIAGLTTNPTSTLSAPLTTSLESPTSLALSSTFSANPTTTLAQIAASSSPALATPITPTQTTAQTTTQTTALAAENARTADTLSQTASAADKAIAAKDIADTAKALSGGDKAQEAKVADTMNTVSKDVDKAVQSKTDAPAAKASIEAAVAKTAAANGITNPATVKGMQAAAVKMFTQEHAANSRALLQTMIPRKN
ncbi:MAG: hypothetical protein HQK82_15160, partial [Desulfovibrionaceae bacterium]|nr:hypothetical protein [Desulfovibrionaceae bacterium]